MKLLISTPCFGGILTEKYVSSLMTCTTRAIAEELVTGFQIHFQGKESLIHRARNRAALYMIEHGFDKLLTIDADMIWTYEDFERIVTSDKDLIGGTYPLKTFPIVLNFNPLPGKGTELFSESGRGIDYDKFQLFKKAYADERGIAEVNHLPTGFLCAKRKVFEKLGESTDIYEDLDASTGTRKRFMHFYSSDVHNGILESEDWSFCRRAREAGFPVFFDTKVITGHTGTHDYRLGQVFSEKGKNEA